MGYRPVTHTDKGPWGHCQAGVAATTTVLTAAPERDADTCWTAGTTPGLEGRGSRGQAYGRVHDELAGLRQVLGQQRPPHVTAQRVLGGRGGVLF